MSPDAKAPDPRLQEWQQCVQSIDKYEDRLDGLRRYGFTFIAGLLSADALLGQVSNTMITPEVKLVVMSIAAFLIAIMRLLDRNYQLWQRILGDRARKVESALGLTLENDIMVKYKQLKMWRYVDSLYYGFEVIILVLGLAITWGNLGLVILAIVIPVIAMIFMGTIERSILGITSKWEDLPNAP